MTVKKPRAKTLVDLQQEVRSAGLKWTTARGAVLRVLDESTSPVTHQDIVSAMTPQGVEASTVHRNLSDFFDAGLLNRFDVGDHVWRYERARDGDASHPHFMCESCGVVECLRDAAIKLQKTSKRIGRVTAILLKGQCASCA
jgi:Fur family transcriptional regulator, ferric uptake regulator